MKVILIDPWTRSIDEVHIPSTNNLQAIYHQLSHEPSNWKVDMVEAFSLYDTHTMLVDEEALIRIKGPPPCFAWHHQRTVWGKGLVLGLTPDGEDWTDCKLTLDHVKAQVVWMET